LLVSIQPPGGLLQGLNEDSLAVQQAISDKMGAFLQHITTFVVGYIVAFWRGWDMTLVMVGCLPFLAAAGSVLARVATTMGNKQAEAYTEVGAGLGSTHLDANPQHSSLLFQPRPL
jgi:ATP-binding cassette subfamily B (MDR/TAP) protein 1